MEVMTQTAWSAWFNEKYQEYLAMEEGKGTMVGFARMFGAPHQVVRAWLREGAHPPAKPEYQQRIMDLYGAEAYKAMGLKPPKNAASGKNLNETRAVELLREVPPEHQAEVLDLIELYLVRHGFKRTG